MTKKTKIITLSLIALIAVMVFSFWSKPILAETTDKIVGAVASTLANSIFLIVSWILYIPAFVAGKISLVIIGLLVQVAKFNKIINVDAVNTAWLTMRDICNMFFVVILLIMSFGTVLGLEKWNYKKLLSQLIIAAIMVNFSKMICGLLIDAGQVVMITFVDAFADSAPSVLANATGLSTLFSLTRDAGYEISNLALGGTILLNMFFVLTSFVVILAIFLILVIRVGMLWFLVALSPIAWVGSLLPATSSYASEWWTNFTKWIMIGPILAFFLWFSLLIFQTGGISKSFPNVPATNEKGSVTATLSQLSESPNTLNYAFSIVLLLMSLTFAQKLGGKAAGVAVGWAKKAEMGKLLLGATGVTGSFKAEKKAIQEKISETPYARVLTASGRAAMQQGLDDKQRLRFGVPGAYEKIIQRQSKEHEESGDFRNVDEMKKKFTEAVENRDWVTAEIFGRQLNKEKKLGMKDLKPLADMKGLAGREEQKAFRVLDKLAGGASDYNKAVGAITPKWENGKYRAKKTEGEIGEDGKIKISERDEALEKVETGAGKTYGLDITKSVAGMNNADEYEEEARFYVGLSDNQLEKMPEKTEEQIISQLEKIISSTNYVDDTNNPNNPKNKIYKDLKNKAKEKLAFIKITKARREKTKQIRDERLKEELGMQQPEKKEETPSQIFTADETRTMKKIEETIEYLKEKREKAKKEGDAEAEIVWSKELAEYQKKLIKIINSRMS